jgi:hypothetical protein
MRLAVLIFGGKPFGRNIKGRENFKIGSGKIGHFDPQIWEVETVLT